jgi:superfamily II DNA or RNA helicase
VRTPASDEFVSVIHRVDQNPKEALLAELTREEARLAVLDREREEARSPPCSIGSPPLDRVESDAGSGIQGVYRALARDQLRNRLILDDVLQTLAERGAPIVLTENKDHLDYLATETHAFARHVLVLRSGMSAKKRRGTAAKLATIPDEEERILLATGRYIGKGFDDPRLDTLFLARAMSWKGRLVQREGLIGFTRERARCGSSTT